MGSSEMPWLAGDGAGVAAADLEVAGLEVAGLVATDLVAAGLGDALLADLRGALGAVLMATWNPIR
jgi:hypothetical protein